MTKKQKREYKIGNQIRKLNILKRGMSHSLGGCIQDGKYTETAMDFWNKIGLKKIGTS